MNLGLRMFGLGCGALLVLACEPEIRSLGDEPLSGSGGSNVLPKPGSGGATDHDPMAEGGVTHDDPIVEGGATHVDPVVEGGATQDCWSPVQRLPTAVDSPAPVCGCEPEQGECLNVFPIVDSDHAGVFFCVEGRWKDLAVIVNCAPGSSCQVNDVIYPSNWRQTPTPYSFCNTCECRDGELVNCTGYKCADTPCPADTWAARKCVACGPAGGCQVYETGCFPEPECEDGLCGAPCF